MERLSIVINAHAHTTFEDGTVVNVQKLDAPRPNPSSVAHHEAAHVVAAGEIYSATIIPSGDALGATYPVRMTAASAAAAAALGHDGTGWDMFLTEHILGVDPGVAKAAARSALSGRSEEMHEVATILEEKGTIGQSDVERARQNVTERRQGIFPIGVEIISPDGQRKSVTTKSFHNEIKMADLLN